MNKGKGQDRSLWSLHIDGERRVSKRLRFWMRLLGHYEEVEMRRRRRVSQKHSEEV